MDGRENPGQDLMLAASWTIGEACAWISCRSPAAAAQLWGSNFYDDLFEDEREALAVPLIEGAITASGIIRGERKPIDALEWEDAAFSFDLREDAGLIHRLHTPKGIYDDVRLPRRQVVTVWPEELRALADVAAFQTRSGRPPLYDWQSFYDRVVSIMDDEGDFVGSVDPTWNQAELERRMADWCEKWPKQPGESTIRSHVLKGAERYRAMRGQ